MPNIDQEISKLQSDIANLQGILEKLETLRTLRQEISKLEQELGYGTTKKPSRDPSKWYPDNRNWVEHSPQNPVDRSKVVDFMRQYERDSCQFQAVPTLFNFTMPEWNNEYDWNCDGGDKIVAVVLKD